MAHKNGTMSLVGKREPFAVTDDGVIVFWDETMLVSDEQVGMLIATAGEELELVMLNVIADPEMWKTARTFQG